MAAGNPFEQVARERKIGRLVEQIDLELSAVGVDPRRDSSVVLPGLLKWEPSDWAKLAALAAVRPPSPETIAAVVEVYRRRAAKAAS